MHQINTSAVSVEIRKSGGRPGPAAPRIRFPAVNAGGMAVVEFLEQRLCFSALFTPASGSPVSVGLAPEFVAEGDFNGDGKPDLAIANSSDNTVSILLGNGDGTFTPAAGSPIAVGTGAAFVTVGDFNGDGKLDLAVANSNHASAANTVSILLGNGNGTFTAASGSPVALGNQQISLAASAAADFNGDGKLDLAVTNSGDNTVSILLGNGDGTFSASSSPVAAGSGPVAVTVGDFNGDGTPDLAVANFGDNTVSVFLGNGDGTFTEATGSPVAVGMEPDYVVSGDFNGDGKPDLAVANLVDNTVSILLGNGDGTFTPATGSPITVGMAPDAIALGDFNNDGKVDLIVANSGDNTVSVLLGNGDGTFSADSPSAVGTAPASIAVGAFEQSPNMVFQPGLAVANSGDNTLSVLLNTTPPIATPTPTPTPTPLPSGTLGVTVTASVPASIVAGVKTKASAVVTVTDPAAVAGKSTVTLYAAPTQSLDNATQLLSVPLKLKLKAGGHKSLRLKLSSFPSTLQGSYYLIAAIQAPDGTTTAVAGPSLTVAAPVVTVVTSNLAGAPASVAPGKKLAVSFTLQNSGNVPAAGKTLLTISLSTSSSGAGGTTVATPSLRVKLNARQSKVFRVKIAVPAGTVAGNYYVATSLDVGALGDTVIADGIAVSSVPVIVT